MQKKNGLDPKNIVVVSVMPCIAKKFEIKRDDQDAAGEGIPDTDISITTRELSRLINRAHLDFVNLPDEEFDDAMGISTGAAAIFGATGGVMEAALRTAADVLEGKSLDNIDYTEVRGTEGIKEAVYHVGGMDVKVAAVSGLSNANEVLEKVRKGEADYHLLRSCAARAVVSMAAASRSSPQRSAASQTSRACVQRRSTKRTRTSRCARATRAR